MFIDVDDEPVYTVRTSESKIFVQGDSNPMRRHEAEATRDMLKWMDPECVVEIVIL